MPELELSRLLKGANTRATVLVVVLSICGALSLIGALALLSQASLLQEVANGATLAPEAATANDARIELIGSVQQFSTIVAVIAWLVWLHWAYRTMRAMGVGGSDITPGWAVGYWFVPVINLYRPYRTVRELLARSEQGNGAGFSLSRSNTTVVGVWWATWLLSNGLTRVAVSESETAQELPALISSTNLLIAASSVSLLAAALAIAVVRRISGVQQVAAAAPVAPSVAPSVVQPIASPVSPRVSPNRETNAGLRLAVIAAIVLVAASGWWILGNKASESTALTAPEIAERARTAIVQVRALGATGDVVARGTGFFIAPNGLIVTNLHVIQDGQSLEVESSRGDIYDIIHFVTADARRDIAILKVPVDDATPLVLADQTEPAVGEQVFVMGNPLGQVGTFSDGLVSAHRVVDGVTLMQITAPISPGSSGGPVMNSAGKVVGLATLTLRGGQSLNYAVPSRYVRPLVVATDEPQRFSQSVVMAAIGGRVTPSGQAAEPATPRRARSGTAAARDAIGPQFHDVDSLVRARGGVALSEIVRGDLDESKDSRHPVKLIAGKIYLIAAYCDDDCSDLDLLLENPNGLPIETDTKDDDSPLLRVEAKSSGEHKLVVSMVKCSIAPCSYGVRLYSLPR